MNRIETLVKEVRDKWQSQAKEVRNFLKEYMSKEHLIAVQVNDLDRQVEYGGFRQWYYQGYDIDLEDLIKYCQEIGSESCMKVKTLLEHLREIINSFGDTEEAVKLLRDNGFVNYAYVLDEVLLEKLLTSVDRYSLDYYNVRRNFLSDVEEYLRSLSCKKL